MAVRFPDPPQYFDISMLQSVIAVAKKGRALGSLYYPAGVAIDPTTHKIYIAEGAVGSRASNSARVSIFSETGEFLEYFTDKHMVRPWGIAIHRDNIYVSDKREHLVFHFKVASDIILLTGMLGSSGDGIGQFNEPRQLSVSDSGDLFIADCQNHRIHILDSNLIHKQFIVHHTMACPCDVKLTASEVYVLTRVSPCVHIFSQSGEKLHSLITHGDGMQVTNAHFFCLDTNRNLIISDCGSNRIKMFSKEGMPLHTLGDEGNEVGMFWLPRGLVLLNEIKLIIVSWSRYYGLQIFKC